MHAVRRLLPDHRARAVDHLAADLLAPVGRQAVQEPRVGRAPPHQRVVDGEAGERGPPRCGLLLLAHRRPHVGVDGVGALHRVVGVVGELDGAAEVAGPFDGDVVELVARRRRDGELDARERGGEGERRGDVVAVADVGEPAAFERAEAARAA